MPSDHRLTESTNINWRSLTSTACVLYSTVNIYTYFIVELFTECYLFVIDSCLCEAACSVFDCVDSVLSYFPVTPHLLQLLVFPVIEY